MLILSLYGHFGMHNMLPKLAEPLVLARRQLGRASTPSLYVFETEVLCSPQSKRTLPPVQLNNNLPHVHD